MSDFIGTFNIDCAEILALDHNSLQKEFSQTNFTVRYTESMDLQTLETKSNFILIYGFVTKEIDNLLDESCIEENIELLSQLSGNYLICVYSKKTRRLTF